MEPLPGRPWFKERVRNSPRNHPFGLRMTSRPSKWGKASRATPMQGYGAARAVGRRQLTRPAGANSFGREIETSVEQSPVTSDCRRLAGGRSPVVGAARRSGDMAKSSRGHIHGGFRLSSGDGSAGPVGCSGGSICDPISAGVPRVWFPFFHRCGADRAASAGLWVFGGGRMLAADPQAGLSVMKAAAQRSSCGFSSFTQRSTSAIGSMRSAGM